jgi:aspartate racemase
MQAKTIQAQPAHANATRTKAIGILGGMGPLATVDLQQKILDATPALHDQDHCDVWVANLASIPPRVPAIEAGGPSPLPAMQAALAKLVQLDVGVVVMPCNTAHYWYGALTACISTPFIHIADATLAALSAPKGGRVAVLGTAATIKLEMYQSRLAAAGWQPFVLDDDARTASIIKQVKAGELKRAGESLAPVVRECFDSECSAVILACTELPIAAAHAPFTSDERARLVDPTHALAVAAVRAVRLQQP